MTVYKISLGAGLVLLMMALPGFVMAAGEVGAGREKAKMCVRCHGPEGVSRNAGVPDIAGMPPEHLVSRLQQYRSRELRGTAMRQVARDLSDQDIENLAAYFAGLGGLKHLHD